ncbi:MAG TPA: hypothetical protein VGJ28_19040 [Micromonosporaceae bacterium]
MARKTSHSLATVADKAVDTWNELSSTLEGAVGRTQSAAHDAKDSFSGTRKSAEARAKKARKNAEKSVTDARKSMKSARKETKRRTSAARDALAGRKPRRGWATAAGLIGIAIGAVAGLFGARIARQAAEAKALEGTLSPTSAAAGDTSSVIADQPPVATVPPARAGADATTPNLVAPSPVTPTPVMGSTSPASTKVATKTPSPSKPSGNSVNGTPAH